MNILSLDQNKQLWFLLIAALLILSSGLGLRDPWPADEPRFALIARDMVETGQWFFPRVAGVLYPDKPPVFFWSIAFFYLITGSLRIAFLLPSLIAGLVTLWLVYDLGRRLWGHAAGLGAGVILLTSLQFVLQAKSAQIDAMVCMWITLGIYGLSRHLLLGPAWGWYSVAFAAMGLGIITKGVGFLPILFLPAWLLAKRFAFTGLAEFNGRLWDWLKGPAVFAFVLAAWLLPMLVLVSQSADPALEAYRDNILFKQTAARYANPWHHFQPFWYYLVEVLPFLWFPLSVALFWLVPGWWACLKQRDGRIFSFLVWVLFVLVFFSLSPGKRGVYILPALPVLALSSGPLLQEIAGKLSFKRTALIFTLLFAFLALAAWLHYAILAPEKAMVLTAKYPGVQPWGLLLVLGIVGLIWAGFGRIKRGVVALIGFHASFWFLFGWLGFPVVNDARSPATLMQNVSAIIGPDAELGLVDWKEQLVLHSDRDTTHFGFRRNPLQEEMYDGLAWLTSQNGRWLLISDAVPLDCVIFERVRHAGFRHRRNWYLLAADAVTPVCHSEYRGRPKIQVLAQGPRS
ncbi:MAG: glycosyltransferase family 39 protein [Gammaproteobacteria bacterium]|nr:glycosyltransferase family 39 protein [Gammaproteobacteria bacterium]